MTSVILLQLLLRCGEREVENEEEEEVVCCTSSLQKHAASKEKLEHFTIYIHHDTQMTRFFRLFASTYDRLLRKHPLPVKCLTSGVVVGSSDVVVQLTTPDHIYDLRRTGIIGIGYGALVFAPVIHFVTTTWARVLPSTTLRALFLKTTVDMTTVFPFNVSVMLGMNAVARNDADPINSIQNNFWPSYSAGWAVWPLVGLTMYRWIPLPYRVLYVNSISFFWNGYLCFRFTDEKSDETLEQTADTVEDITQKLNPLDS